MSDPNKPQTELAGTPAKDDEPRESLASRLKPFILVFLLLFLPVALFHAFTDYMYVCRIHLPAGTKVVDASVLPERSPLGQFICDSALIRKWHWDWITPYLGYRHYIIPEGTEEIGLGAFNGIGICNNLRSVRIPGSVKTIGDGAFASCGKLTDIIIPGSVEQMGDDVFKECRSLHRIVEKTGRTSDYVEIEIPCDNLTDRKQLMMDQSDVFIALPGGIGTLDEIFTVASSATIGYHQKTVILYNMKGFWDELITLLNDLQAKGMIRGDWRDYIKTADSIEEIIPLLS